MAAVAVYRKYISGISGTKIRLGISVLQVFTIAVLGIGAAQMSSFTLCDPTFGGLRLPQTPPILNTDIYYLQLVSAYAVDTRRDSHACRHTSIHVARTRAHAFCVVVLCACVSVCEVRTMDDDEIFKQRSTEPLSC